MCRVGTNATVRMGEFIGQGSGGAGASVMVGPVAN